MPQLRSTRARSRPASLTDSTEASASTMLAMASSPVPSSPAPSVRWPVDSPMQVWNIAAASAEAAGSSGRTRSSSARAAAKSSQLVSATDSATARITSSSELSVIDGSACSSATVLRSSSTRPSPASARAAAIRSGRRSGRACSIRLLPRPPPR